MAVWETVTSNFDRDANGCGSPVLNDKGLIITVLFWWSLETGVLRDAADSEKTTMKKRQFNIRESDGEIELRGKCI
jgi:hypothetical protein